MAASTSDLITQASSSGRPVPTTVSVIRPAATTTLTCLALTGWPTGSKVHFVTYKVDTSGNKVSGSQIDWYGIVSGTTITSITVTAGTDVGNVVGDIVEASPTAAWANDLYNWGIADHDNIGHHADLHGVNSKTVLGLSNTSSSDANNLRISSAVPGSGPTIATEGTDANISPSISGKGTGRVRLDGSQPQPYFALYDFVESGCIWTADSAGVNRNASMTSGFVWIAGTRVSVAAVTSRTFTASKDTYVDVQVVGFTGSVFYTEVANNAASPALSANCVRLGIIVTGATTIATSGSVNQGQESALLPIASSVAYSITDSLGNLICPRDPQRKILGYRQITTNFATTSTTPALATGLTAPCIVPSANRRLKITVFTNGLYNAVSTNGTTLSLWDGTVGTTQLAKCYGISSGGAGVCGWISALLTCPAGTKTFNVALAAAASTSTAEASATSPMFVMVEQV